MSSHDFETVPPGTMKELERLRQAVKAAYFEGYEDGNLDGAVHGENNIELQWIASNAKQDADL